MDAKLTEGIHYSLDNHMYPNAAFLAERLYAHAPTDDALHLLATTYMHLGKANKTAAVLKGATSAQCLFLLAAAYFQLGKLKEAENALKDNAKQLIASLRSHAAAHNLLGQIYKRNMQRELAINHFKSALLLNPLLFTAYEALCALGHDALAEDVFVDEASAAVLRAGAATPSIKVASQPVSFETPAAFVVQQTPTTAVRTPAAAVSFANSPQVLGPHTPAPLDVGTPQQSTPASPSPTSVPLLTRRRAIELRKKKLLGTATRGVASPSAIATPVGKTTRAMRLSFSTQEAEAAKSTEKRGTPARRAPLRKAARTSFAEKESMTIDNSASILQSSKAPPRFTISSAPGSPALKPLSIFRPPAPTMQLNDLSPMESASATQTTLALLQTLGTGVRLLSRYQCEQAVEVFKSLDRKQLRTGWVQCQIGKAYFQHVNYSQAREVFAEARQLEPHRLEDMEIYSTVLWHLRRETDLSFLAHELVELDKFAPQTWCVVGNCFSLQKEHELALKFFQRAIQVDPTFTYAYTLSGHECAANDDLEKALVGFRSATRQDERHYNAWYGIGTVFYRQERYELAEYHFKRALTINPSSSVLQCYVGMTLQASKKLPDALVALERAIELDPKNTLAKFKMATILSTMGKDAEALAILDALLAVAPREGPIHYLMGRVLKKLGREAASLRAFHHAIDLDSKNAAYIKTVMEKQGKDEMANYDLS